MAKTPAKKAAPATKAASEPKKAPEKKTPAPSIEAANISALDKLRSLNVAEELQSEIEWCLASYRGDGNPVGLYQMIERAVAVFRDEIAKKTKGVTGKFVADLEKALESR